jgi:hypothetical protein
MEKKIMSLNARMNEKKDAIADQKAAARNTLLKNERSYRADCLVEAWSRIPQLGVGLKDMPLTEARNVAINLDRQAAYMRRMSEAQTSSNFSGFTPENMLRLVRLAMPNVVRNKIFTEFAMETARDSIKYLKPVFSKTQNGKDLNNRATDPNAKNGSGTADDPWAYNDVNGKSPDENGYDNNAKKLHEALYESTEDRYVQELANATAADANATLTDGKVTAATAAADATKPAFMVFDADNFKSRNDDATYNKLMKGYTVVYFGDETHPIAIEDKNSHKFAIIPDFKDYVSAVEWVAQADTKLPEALKITYGSGTVPTEVTTDLTNKGVTAAVRAYARYDSEDDFDGDYLGEVQLRMFDYEFRPRPTTIGVTWSQLSELVLDSSFNVNAEEELVTYAAQEIRVALDYKAIKLAYQAALSNDSAYIIHFNAAVEGTGVTTSATATTNGISAFGYTENAQTLVSAFDKMADVMLNDMNRGGVSRLVAGPAAGSYCKLHDKFTPTGKQPNIGAHQIGEFDGLPLFKVPSSIVPNNRILTVYKNEANDADVSLVFGTLVPFFSTGTIVRKNFYKEAGIASYGDWALLNKRYLGIVQIDNIKDAAAN